jgi:hypothetical protein
MLWPMWVVLIAGSTGSALRAVRPPNLHVSRTAAAQAASAVSMASTRMERHKDRVDPE